MTGQGVFTTIFITALVLVVSIIVGNVTFNMGYAWGRLDHAEPHVQGIK